jgi:hypothetical protein
MKFIDRILPFTSKAVFNENALTSYWVIFLILFFLISVFYLLYFLRIIRRSISIDNLGKSNRIEKIWIAYQSSFSEYNKERKTSDFSENYFNEQAVFFTGFNMRAVNNVSNTLIGLGILGTFVGLTYGIADSNFESSEEIKNSINNLLSGMGTAFVSSIWGMGLSLLFGNILKISHSTITRRLQWLCLELDNQYKISQPDLEEFNIAQQRNIINELFNEYLVADTDDGRKQLPKNIFRQLLEESEKQTNSLQTFADDLGDSISAAMDKLVEDNNQQIKLLIEEKLVPVLEELKEIKQDSGTKIIEDVVNRLTDALQSMMDDFKETIVADTNQEMEGLIRRLTTVSESLVGIPETMTDITLQVGETIESLRDTVIKSVEKSVSESVELHSKSSEMFTNATTDYKSTVEDIQDHMELLLSTQKDNIRQVSDITDSVKASLKENSQVNKQFTIIIAKSKIVAQLIEGVANKFENNSKHLSNTSSSLESITSKFKENIEYYINRNEKLLNHQEETLQTTKELTTLYSKRFESIQKGLTGIFDQIQIGLKDYQSTTASGLNQYLTEFSTVLTAAHQGLENNISGLSDITDELTDQVEKMAARK